MWPFRKHIKHEPTLARAINLVNEGPLISFCITHKDRLKYLKQTLNDNLSALSASIDSDIVLVDFNDNDETVHWIRNNFIREIQSQRLKFFHTRELKKWSSPIAKNTAHMVATGQIVTNLDCDNFIGIGGDQFITDQFIEDDFDLFVWQYSGIKRDGSFGRMSLRKKVFEELGGYNESFLEMGYQDNDLKHRATRFGLKLVHRKEEAYNRAIVHEKYQPTSLSFKKMNRHNEKLSKQLIKENILIANAGNFGIREGLFKMNANGELISHHLDL